MNLDIVFNLDAFLEQAKPHCRDPYTDTIIYKAEEIYRIFLFNNDLQDDEYVYYIFERRMMREKATGVAFIG